MGQLICKPVLQVHERRSLAASSLETSIQQLTDLAAAFRGNAEVLAATIVHSAAVLSATEPDCAAETASDAADHSPAPPDMLQVRDL